MAMDELEDARHTNFVSVLVYGTVSEDCDGEMQVREVDEGEKAQMWSVYGRNPEGTRENLADFVHQVHAWYFTAHLAATLNVPVERYGLNLEPLEAAVFMLNSKGTKQ